MIGVAEWLSGLRAEGVRVWLEEDRLRYRAPKGIMTPARLSALREREAEIRDWLSGGLAAPIPRLADAPAYEVSHAQRRLWILHQVDPHSAAYHIDLHQRLDGPLDALALDAALARLVARHESLRTTFRMLDGEPKQIVHPSMTVTLEHHDVSGAPDAETAARDLARAHSARPFDLEHGPLARAALVRLGPDRHVLLFTMHHIISDGVSIGLIGRDLARLYAGGGLPPLPLQYRDFAAWQNARLAGAQGDAQRDYWHRQLAGPLPVLNLVEDLPRPAVLTSNGRELLVDIEADLAAALTALGRQRGASLFMVLVAGLAALLHRHTGQDDIIIGSPAAGRTHADLDDQVGFFLNTLAIRTPVTADLSFERLVDHVAASATAAFEHQDYPFERLVTELHPSRDTSRSPIFDVMLIFQNDVDGAMALPDIEARAFAEHNGTSRLDLSFNVKRSGAGLLLGVEYNTDLFVEARVRAMAEHFLTLLRGAAADPSAPVGQLPLMPAAERDLVLHTFNATHRECPLDDALIDLFEQQAGRAPDAIAVTHAGRSTTYAELNAHANRMARHLQARSGFAPGDAAVITLPSGVELLATLLAVMKLRGAAALLEPPVAPERLSFILADSRSRVLVTASRPEALAFDGTVIEIDDERHAVAGHPDGNLEAGGRRHDDAVLLFFTSGSTGRPKGVPLDNRNLLNELGWFSRHFEMTPCDVLAQKTVLSFADAIVELLLPITVLGGAVHLRPDYQISGDFPRLAGWFNEIGATILQFVPAVFEELTADVPAESLTTLRALILSGGTVTRHPSYPFRVYNLYGCSECTALSTWYDMTGPAPLARVPIGRPLQNTTIYILDEAMQPCPLFVPGEIYVGGDLVAAGYLHRPDVTAERFLASPFRAGERLFRTGDFGRWLHDGNVDYLGRRDDQIKIRGLRIECGEIEVTLREHPQVREAVVVGRTQDGMDPYLAAYVLASEPRPDGPALRAHLARTLPGYMIPPAIVFLDAYPRTSSGKINRGALPRPDLQAGAEPVVAPRNGVEEAIARVWRDVLGVETISIHDDFLTLGGHSLRATRVASRLSREFGVALTLMDVFRHPTVAGLAEVVAHAAPAATIAPIRDIDEIAPASADELEFLR